MIGLLLLPCRQLIGLLCHRVETAGGVLLLHAAEQIGGLAQAVGGAPGISRAGTLGSGAPHVVVCLTQAIERLLGGLLTAVRSLVRGLLRIAGASLAAALARLAARLTGRRLTGSGTTLAALRARLSLLPLLSLLTILRQLLLHLSLQLFRLALQHLLLPLLLGGLGAVALLLSQIFLTPGQFVELFQSVGDFLGFLLGGRRSGLLRLVLVFLSIEFEIEQTSQIARGAATTTSTTAPSQRNLNLPESSFGAQQRLQCLLLVGNRVLPLLLLQLLGGRRHRFGGGDHILLEGIDGLYFIGQLAGLQAAGK